MEEKDILKLLVPKADFKVLGSATEGPGKGAGAASVMGVMDRGGDVIALGAFTPVLDSFLKNGVVTLGHDYQGLSIGMPESCEEQGKNLSTTWEYHSTPKAQEARTVAMERIAKGLSVGLSVGFQIDMRQRQWFDDGESMWAFLEKMAPSMLGFYDQESIKSYKDSCRLIIGVKELYEYAQCSVPMNAMAVMTDAKRFGEAGLPAGQSLSAHLDSVLAAVEGATSRLASYKATRDKDDRPMSPARIQQALDMRSRLDDLIKSAERHVKGSNPDDVALLDKGMKIRAALATLT